MPPEVPELVREFDGADLGDLRRDRRLMRLAELIQRSPTDSETPLTFGRGAELEAAYRFLNNDAVEASSIAESHIAATLARCQRYDRVFVVHDTTEFAFSGVRSGMYRLNGKRRGFCGHFSIAVSGDGGRHPLGLLAYGTLERAERRGTNWFENFLDPRKESLRWVRAVIEAEEVLAVGPSRAVHLMDREGDSYELLASLAARQHDFVVRSNHDRRLAEVGEVLSTALAGAEVRALREVQLGRRGLAAYPAQRTRHPARDERGAKLAIRALRVEVRKPHHVKEPATLALNVVEVREEEAPKGQDPVAWRLLTTLPIDTAEQMLEVVDAYRTRWLIEEFFKAIKTGCAFMQRQHESREALERLLMITAAQAWRLLLIRWLGRQNPSGPADYVVTPAQLGCLRRMAKYTKMSRKPTAEQVLLAVAEIGGHLPQNGPPGWMVLGRGFDKLSSAEIGWEAAMRASAQRAAKRGTAHL